MHGRFEGNPWESHGNALRKNINEMGGDYFPFHWSIMWIRNLLLRQMVGSTWLWSNSLGFNE